MSVKDIIKTDPAPKTAPVSAPKTPEPDPETIADRQEGQLEITQRGKIVSGRRFKFQISEHMVILGTTGMGKTQWLYSFFKNVPLKPWERIVSLNTMNLDGWRQVGQYEHTEAGNLVYDDDEKHYRLRGLMAVELPELERVLALKPEIVDGKITKMPPQRIVITPPLRDLMRSHEIRDYNEYMFQYFDEVCRIVFDRGNTILVVDEGQLVVDGEDMPPNMKILVFQGRNQKVSLCFAIQRHQDFPKRLTDMVYHYVLFWNNPRNRDALKNTVPFIQATAQLAPYYWLHSYREVGALMNPVPLTYNDRKSHAKNYLDPEDTPEYYEGLKR